MTDLLKDLNDRQKEAVTARLGPVLVLAGAGSGKTRALTYRIAWLLSEKKFKPENILALTFTNKAAGEMKERIVSLVGKSVKQKPAKFMQFPVTMGTFHSVCARILRKEIQHLNRGYNGNFTIYDSDDSLRLLKQIALEKGLAEQVRPQVFAYYIGQAKSRLVEPRQVVLDNGFLGEALSEVAEEYGARLREQNALDFDDLLCLVYELWKNDSQILRRYQDRFGYVLVDEYQDTNHVQYMLLKMLVKKHRNLFVVGDDAQSIYGFRGANMQNILDFQKDYPKAKIIILEQNYRSTGHILDAANEVIKLNPFQYEKNLWTDNPGGHKVNLYEATDETDEGEFVLRQILRETTTLVEDEPEPESGGILDKFMRASHRWRRPRIIASELPEDLNQTVILYRTHAQSRPFEELLLSAGVPYQVVGGFKFYERREIKDALAYLRLLNNQRDLVSLERVINIPPRGIGPATLRAVVADLQQSKYDFVDTASRHDKAGDFFEALSAGAALPKKRPVGDLLELLLIRSGYKMALLADRDQGAERWENIEELFNVAAKYRSLPWPEGLQAFLEEVALMTDLDRMEEGQSRLTLMTLHSAKGLEFDKVFFVGLEEGILPHSRSMLNPAEIAEEIRLAYVGITRARSELFLSYALKRQVYGELRRTMPSRILKAVPKKLINKISNQQHGNRI